MCGKGKRRSRGAPLRQRHILRAVSPDNALGAAPGHADHSPPSRLLDRSVEEEGSSADRARASERRSTGDRSRFSGSSDGARTSIALARKSDTPGSRRATAPPLARRERAARSGDPRSLAIAR